MSASDFQDAKKALKRHDAAAEGQKFNKPQAIHTFS
jgi:hypothetical protein